MKTIQFSIGVDDFIKNIEQLDIPELEQITRAALNALAIKRIKKTERAETDDTETVLIQKIKGAFPDELQEKFLALQEKKRINQLSEEEHQELLKIIYEFENLNVERLKNLGVLAQIKNVPVLNLMRELQLQPLPNGQVYPAYAL